jgi:hypothetical protein
MKSDSASWPNRCRIGIDRYVFDRNEWYFTTKSIQIRALTMGTKAGVWIDHKQAIIVLLTDAGREIRSSIQA